MENVIISQITSNLNITIVVLLLIVGAVFKHWITVVDNKYIPIILCGLGIVFTLIFHLPIEVNSTLGVSIVSFIIEGIASGIAATIVHSKGKDIIAELWDKDRIIENVESDVDKAVQEQLDKLASIDFSNIDEEIAKEMGEELEHTESENMVDISEVFTEE